MNFSSSKLTNKSELSKCFQPSKNLFGFTAKPSVSLASSTSNFSPDFNIKSSSLFTQNTLKSTLFEQSSTFNEESTLFKNASTHAKFLTAESSILFQKSFLPTYIPNKNIKETKKKPVRKIKLLESVEGKKCVSTNLPQCQLIDYKFNIENGEIITEGNFVAVDSTPNENQIKRNLRANEKRKLINLVSGSLIRVPNFKKEDDQVRKELINVCDEICTFDPEFVLKLALYARQELNIRSTANFLLAYSAKNEKSRIYLKSYFSPSIALPSDWIDVAEQYQIFGKGNKIKGTLPVALRRAMIKKFESFDQYQLGKYNKDPKKAKKKRLKRKEKLAKKMANRPISRIIARRGVTRGRGRAMGTRNSITTSSSAIKPKEDKENVYTLKKLIRQLHINKPVENVMCIIGKKYPSSLNLFYKSNLPGVFDETKCGQRMKLPIPETWETQISKFGNKAEVWEKLLDDKKLPFMAMLRNLRNMIKAGISDKHHSNVIGKLTNEKTIANSKQFPFRFFSAYVVLNELKDEYAKYIAGNPVVQKTSSTTSSLNTKRGRGRKVRPGGVEKTKTYKIFTKMFYDENIIEKYKKAIDKSIILATNLNVAPIKGKTIVLLEATNAMNEPCQTAKGLSAAKTKLQVGALLGLMFKYVCESCEFLIFNETHNYDIVKLKKGTILDNMGDVYKVKKFTDSENNLDSYLLEFLIKREKIDNIIVLATNAFQNEEELSPYLNLYRESINPDLLYVRVNLGASEVNNDNNKGNDRNVMLSGFSDQILRFVSERGNTGLLDHVENIDRSYKIENVREKSKKEVIIEIPKTIVQVWKEYRIFISSTFRDMHGERNLLTKFILPEIARKAENLYIQVVDIDLRWGVEEENTKSESVSICLEQVLKADLIIGLLGNRYGWIPNRNDWKDDYKQNCFQDDENYSITDMEMRLALWASKPCLFFMRNNGFFNSIPNEYKTDFIETDQKSIEKLNSLRKFLKRSGSEVSEYYCSWGGFIGNSPCVTNLHKFGDDVLSKVWSTIEKSDKTKIDVKDKFETETANFDFYFNSLAETFVSREKLLASITKTISNKREMFIISGKNCCGKSSLIAKYVQNQRNKYTAVLIHSFGYSELSADISNCLHRFNIELIKQLKLSIGDNLDIGINIIDTFNKILKEISTLKLTKPILLIFDDIDTMNDQLSATSLNWLSNFNSNANITMLFTVRDKSPIFKTLQRLKPKIIDVKQLDLIDKSLVIKSQLGRFGKSLSEFKGDNQLSLLVNKRESNNPLYLKIACDELKVFGVFEKIHEKLKCLPQTIDLLLTHCLERLEADYGETLVKYTMSLLTCSLGGFGEADLRRLLMIFFQPKNFVDSINFETAINFFTEKKFDFGIAYAILRPFLNSIRAFRRAAEYDEDNISLAQTEIVYAIRNRYDLKDENERLIHIVLAAYCYVKGYKGDNSKLLAKLIKHLQFMSNYEEIATLITSFEFIEKMFQNKLGYQLLSAFKPVTNDKIKERIANKYLVTDRIKDYETFISTNSCLFSRHSNLVWQEAINQPNISVVSKDIQRIIETTDFNGKFMFHWLNKSNLMNPCKFSIKGISKSVNCIDISPNKENLVCGSDDCIAHIFNLITGKEVRNLIGHSGSITAVCFVNSNIIVTASTDQTICTWDVNTGQRLSVRKEHRREISCLLANPNGKEFASTSWDSTLKIWNLIGNNSTWTFSDAKRPINCSAYEPIDGNKIVIGDWNSTVRIFDVYNRKRIAILRGHNSSVRAVTYSPNAVYIASAAMDGEVALWSAEFGTKLGWFKNCSNSQVNSLAFSLDGRMLSTANDDGSINIWNGKLGIEEMHFKNECKTNEISSANSIRFGPNTNELSVGYQDGFIKIYDLIKKSCIEKKFFKFGAIACIDIFSEAKDLIYGSEKGVIGLYEKEKKKKNNYLKITERSITCIKVKTSTILVGSSDTDIYIVTYVKDGLSLTNTIRDCHKSAVTGLDMQNNLLISASRDLTVKVWSFGNKDFDKPTCVNVYDQLHSDWINSMSINDGLILTSSNDFTCKLSNLKDGKILATMKGHDNNINNAIYKENCIASVSTDGLLKIWTNKGAEITSLPILNKNSDRLNDCDIRVENLIDLSTRSYKPPAIINWGDEVDMQELIEEEKKITLERSVEEMKNVYVAIASEDGNVIVYKPIVSRLLTDFCGHSLPVLSVKASENILVSGSRDGSLNMWNYNLSFDSNATEFGIRLHNKEITDIFTIKDRLFLTASLDGVVKLLRLNEFDELIVLEELVGLMKNKPIVSINCWEISKNQSLVSVCSEEGFMVVYKIKITNLKAFVEHYQTFSNILHSANYNKKYRITAIRQYSLNGQLLVFLHDGVVVSLGIKSDDNQQFRLESCIGKKQISNNYLIQVSNLIQRSNRLDILLCDEITITLLSYYISEDETCQQKDRLQAMNTCLQSSRFSWKSSSYLAVNNDTEMIWLTNENGQLTFTDDNLRTKTERNLHEKKITCVLKAEKSSLFFTASIDGIIKVWQDSWATKQIGEYVCRSSVTKMAFYVNHLTHCKLIAGDKMGNVYALLFKI